MTCSRFAYKGRGTNVPFLQWELLWSHPRASHFRHAQHTCLPSQHLVALIGLQYDQRTALGPAEDSHHRTVNEAIEDPSLLAMINYQGKEWNNKHFLNASLLYKRSALSEDACQVHTGDQHELPRRNKRNGRPSYVNTGTSTNAEASWRWSRR